MHVLFRLVEGFVSGMGWIGDIVRGKGEGGWGGGVNTS